MNAELEALLGRIIFLQCRTDAIVEILRINKVKVSDEEIENKTQSIWGSQFDIRRQTYFDDLEKMKKENSQGLT